MRCVAWSGRSRPRSSCTLGLDSRAATQARGRGPPDVGARRESQIARSMPQPGLPTPLGVRRPIAPIVLSTHRWAVKTLDTTGPISVVTSMPPPFRWVRMASTSHGTRESNGASGGLEPGWTSIGERALPVITADDAETERRGSPTVDQRGAMAKAASRYAVLRSRRRIRRGVRREVEAPRLDARCL